MASNPSGPKSLADIAKAGAKPASILPPADPFPAGTRAPGTYADPAVSARVQAEPPIKGEDPIK